MHIAEVAAAVALILAQSGPTQAPDTNPRQWRHDHSVCRMKTVRKASWGEIALGGALGSVGGIVGASASLDDRAAWMARVDACMQGRGWSTGSPG